jgi:hypothetical protein
VALKTELLIVSFRHIYLFRQEMESSHAAHVTALCVHTYSSNKNKKWQIEFSEANFWGRCYDHNGLRSVPIFGGKWRFSQTPML